MLRIRSSTEDLHISRQQVTTDAVPGRVVELKGICLFLSLRMAAWQLLSPVTLLGITLTSILAADHETVLLVPDNISCGILCHAELGLLCDIQYSIAVLVAGMHPSPNSPLPRACTLHSWKPCW